MKKPRRFSLPPSLRRLLVACGKSGKRGPAAAPAADPPLERRRQQGGRRVPSSNRTGLWVDRFRFGEPPTRTASW